MRSWVGETPVTARAAVGSALVAAWLVASSQASPARAQAGSRTVWDGVYTAEQAERGRHAYENSCSACHQPTLTGAGEAPAIVGTPFMDRWREDTVSSLFTRVSTLMPFDSPATLPDETYLDIVAYILQVNTFPAGDRELDPRDLESIRIVAKEGPGTVPNFALVRVIGCLTQDSSNGWLLMHSTEPVRTAETKASAEAELREADAKPLGSQTFRLMNPYPNPVAHKGHKMEAKGFLVRTGDESRINVSSLTMVGASCTP
jgi:mono/diheme cytochrome c family protein